MADSEPYVDEKWKLTKRGSVNARMTGSSSASSSSNTSKPNEGLLRRSDSVPHRGSFSRKCATVVKEQRAKFYIVRRCVTMLMCWKDYRDP